VSVYREVKHEFSVSDRIQFTAPNQQQGISNRELGTIEQLSERQMRVHLDSGKCIEFSPHTERHFDHGYAVTSHSSQGLTADRVLVHVDTAHAHHDLINTRMAHVSVSRDRCDPHIYTNDARKRSAIEPQREPRREIDQAPLTPGPVQAPERSRSQERHIEPSLGFSMGR